jgi:DNA repair protein RecO (recombination protein O)
MKQLSSNGIILRRVDYGEADRIITFLTSDYGKIHAIAKGVRKQKSKLAGGIELFSVSEIHFIKGKSDIDTIISTRLIKNYGHIVKDLNRTEAAYEMLKTINKTLEDHAGSEYFPILNESLAALDDERIPILLSDLSFKMRILQILGHIPEFSVDSRGQSLNENATYEFDYESVSFIAKQEGSFNKNHLKVLKLLAHNSPRAMNAVQGIINYAEQLSPLIKNIFLQYAPN